METTEGERLRAFLGKATGARHGWVTELADAAGVRRQTVYDWFTGKTAPSLASLRALADALKVERYQIVAAMDGEQVQGDPLDARVERLEATVQRLEAEGGAGSSRLQRRSA